MLNVLVTPSANGGKEQALIPQGNFIEPDQGGFLGNETLMPGFKFRLDKHWLVCYLRPDSEASQEGVGLTLTHAAQLTENLSLKAGAPALKTHEEIHVDPTIPDGYDRSVRLDLEHTPDLKLFLFRPSSGGADMPWQQVALIEIAYDPSL